jgi:hypothetical protein
MSAYNEGLTIRRRLVALHQSNALWQEGVSLMLRKIVEFKRIVEDRAAVAEDVRCVGATNSCNIEITVTWPITMRGDRTRPERDRCQQVPAERAAPAQPRIRKNAALVT